MLQKYITAWGKVNTTKTVQISNTFTMTSSVFLCCESSLKQQQQKNKCTKAHQCPRKVFFRSIESTRSSYFLLPGCTRVGTTAMPPVVNTTFSWTLISTRDPSGDGFVPLGTGGTTALTNTSPVTYNLSHASLGRSSAPATSMSQAAASALPAAPCRKKSWPFIPSCFRKLEPKRKVSICCSE